MTTAPNVVVQRQSAVAQARRRNLDSRLAGRMRRLDLRPADPSTPRRSFGGVYRDRSSWRPSYLHARYYDRPDLIHHDYRHTYAYYDSFHRLHHRVIWPSYYYPVYYRFGPHFVYEHVYPYYHRKYVFVSLGGWWPDDYLYLRYFWYGYHPYVWYGYYPIAREVCGDNYTYYTYNYYYQNDDGSYSSDVPPDASVQPSNQATWADVRAKLDQQNAEPAPQTVADTRFDEGVTSFEAGNYGVAADKFAEAMRLAPNDMILPFAYSQALFADGQYAESAGVLRQALSKVSPEKEGVFYPRGLYANDDVLFGQIENLVDQVDRVGYDADMQLLLGYQLLGVGETGYAREPLERAKQDPQNAASATILLNLLDKIESEAGPADKAEESAVGAPDAAAQGGTEMKAQAAPTPDNTKTTTGDVQVPNTSVAPVEKAPKIEPRETPAPDKTGDTAPADQTGSSSEQKDSNTPPVVLPGSTGPSSKAGASGAVGVSLAGFPSHAVSGLKGYLRVDFAVFAGIVLLGWTGVYVQWRLLDHDAA